MGHRELYEKKKNPTSPERKHGWISGYGKRISNLNQYPQIIKEVIDKFDYIKIFVKVCMENAISNIKRQWEMGENVCNIYYR